MVMSLLETGDIPWQCSQCPCEQEIQRNARVYPLLHWRKPCVLPLLLFCQSSSISFHTVQGCSIYRNLPISCVCSCSFPAALSVLGFHVPSVMLSLPRIFDDAPVAYLTPPSWYTAEGAVLVDLGRDWSGMVACFHHMVSHRQGTTWWSPSLSRSNMWPPSSTWNPSYHLAFVFKLWRYLPSDVVLTQAISPITGRLVEGGSISFLPIQIQRTCQLPITNLFTHLLIYLSIHLVACFYFRSIDSPGCLFDQL